MRKPNVGTRAGPAKTSRGGCALQHCPWRCHRLNRACHRARRSRQADTSPVLPHHKGRAGEPVNRNPFHCLPVEAPAPIKLTARGWSSETAWLPECRQGAEPDSHGSETLCSHLQLQRILCRLADVHCLAACLPHPAKVARFLFEKATGSLRGSP